MEFEDLLVEVGTYGKYQKRMAFFFLVPVSALLPIFVMNSVFMVSVPDHWCNVPELDSWNLTLEQQHLLIRPSNDSKCSMYDLSYKDLSESPVWNWTISENTPTTKCFDGYRYDLPQHEKTASTVWNLVCEDSHYNSFILTVVTIGGFLGTVAYGYLSDKFGRRSMVLMTSIVTLVSGVVSVLMTSFSAFAVFRAISGSAMPALFQIAIVILMEIVGPTMRTKMNCYANLAWTIGSCILPLIAWLYRDFVVFGLITSSAPVLFVFYWKFLKESPRWLLSQGRYDEAADVMYNMAKTNGKHHSRGQLLKFLEELGEEAKKKKAILRQEEVSSVDLIKYPNLRKHFLIITVLWVASNVGYYGLQYNISNLDGNEFLNFFYLSVVEFPASFFCWYNMEKWGRRWMAVTILNLTGIVLIVPIFVERSAVVACVIGKFGAYSAYMITYQQASELYPTPLRAIGMGLSGAVSLAVSIAVPYVIYLAEFGRFIPYLVFACVCITAGCAASLLPETLNEVLPQTVADAENFGKEQRFFSCRKRRRPSCCDNVLDVSRLRRSKEELDPNGQKTSQNDYEMNERLLCHKERLPVEKNSHVIMT